MTMENSGVNSKEGYSPLHLAVLNGNFEKVKLCIEKGTNINQKATDPFEKALRDITALHMAASLGHLEIVQCLVSNGAALEETTEQGWTALQLARENGHDAVAKYLIEQSKNRDRKEMNKTGYFISVNTRGNRSTSVLVHTGSPLHRHPKHVRQRSHPDDLSPRKSDTISKPGFNKS